MKRLFCLAVLVAFVLGIGCVRAVHYVPKEYPVHPEAVSKFEGSQAVHVVNVTPDRGEILLGCDSGVVNYMADLRKWTDTAASLLKTELQKKGCTIGGEDAQKDLKLAITDGSVVIGFIFDCTLEFRVETGEGYIGNYKARNKGFTYTRAFDGVITRGVIAILNDSNIIEYITKVEEEIRVHKKEPRAVTPTATSVSKVGTIPLPEYEISPPPLNASPEVRMLLGKWQGYWEGNRSLESVLVVEKIFPEEKRVQCIYAWGPRKERKPGYSRKFAELVPGSEPKIKLRLGEKELKYALNCEFALKGKLLYGKVLYRNSVHKIVMEKIE